MAVSETTIDMLHEFILTVFSSQYGVCYPGKSDGAGGWIIECVSDPGKWFIRIWKNGIVAIDKATPMGVPRDPQQRCLTRVINGERIIEMADPTALRQLYGNYANNAAVGNLPTVVEAGDKSVLGAVNPSSSGGMNASVTAYPAGGLYATLDNIDLSADEPGSSGQFLWDVSYIDTDGTVKWVQSAPQTLPSAASLLISTAAAVVLPADTYRLYAISLGHGQTDINQSRFVNLQDDLTKSSSSGTLELTDGTNDVTGVTKITVTGGTVGGSTPNATLVVGGSSPLTTKGDLYGFSTANVRIPAGADGTVLSYDSGQPTGTRAITLPGGGGGGVITGVLPATCQGRLTLTSGTPIPTSDVTAATVLYFDAYEGNVVALYDGVSTWAGYPFSQLSLALSGLVPYSLHDVFVYDNSGTPTLELTAWNAGATGAITAITNTDPPVATSTAHGRSVDDILAISGVVGATGANGVFRISATTANTFTLQTLAGANPGAPGVYVSGGTWYKANDVGSRATALTTQDGVFVKTGATTRRYLGTLRISATAGQTQMRFSSPSSLLLWNLYHPVEVELKLVEATASWTYSTAAYRPWNNNLANRIEMVVGLQALRTKVEFWEGLQLNAGGVSAGHVGIGLDSISTDSADLIDSMSATNTFTMLAKAFKRAALAEGYHYLQPLEYAYGTGGFTTTWLGTQAAAALIGTWGMQGTTWV